MIYPSCVVIQCCCIGVGVACDQSSQLQVWSWNFISCMCAPNVGMWNVRPILPVCYKWLLFWFSWIASPAFMARFHAAIAKATLLSLSLGLFPHSDSDALLNIYVTGRGTVCVSPRLMGNGWTPILNRRDSPFLRSTPGVVPLTSTLTKATITQARPVYGWV